MECVCLLRRGVRDDFPRAGICGSSWRQHSIHGDVKENATGRVLTAGALPCQPETCPLITDTAQWRPELSRAELIR